MYPSVCKMVSGNNKCIKLSLNFVVSYISKLCLLSGVLSHCIAEAVLSAGSSIWNISQWIRSDQVSTKRNYSCYQNNVLQARVSA